MALVKGPKAKSRRGFRKNIETMERAGYPKKRAVGTAYGEAYLGIDEEEARRRRERARRLARTGKESAAAPENTGKAKPKTKTVHVKRKIDKMRSVSKTVVKRKR